MYSITYITNKESAVTDSVAWQKKITQRDFPGGPVAKTPHSSAEGGLGLIPGRGTRSHMLRLRPGAAK